MQISFQFLNGWHLWVSAEVATDRADQTKRSGTGQTADHWQHTPQHVAGLFDVWRYPAVGASVAGRLVNGLVPAHVVSLIFNVLITGIGHIFGIGAPPTMISS